MKTQQSEIDRLTTGCAEMDAAMSKIKQSLSDSEKNLDDARIELLGVKSEVIEKNSQIEYLMSTLSRKGEEAGELAERLVELKNHMLD